MHAHAASAAMPMRRPSVLIPKENERGPPIVTAGLRERAPVAGRVRPRVAARVAAGDARHRRAADAVDAHAAAGVGAAAAAGAAALRARLVRREPDVAVGLALDVAVLVVAVDDRVAARAAGRRSLARLDGAAVELA